MMMADMNAETIQQRIQIARRDAEALKDRIKRKKDELADTTRKSHRPISQLFPVALVVPLSLAILAFEPVRLIPSPPLFSPRSREKPAGCPASPGHENKENPQGTSCQNLRYALVD